jgi:hypothetical protein
MEARFAACSAVYSDHRTEIRLLPKGHPLLLLQPQDRFGCPGEDRDPKLLASEAGRPPRGTREGSRSNG